MLQGPAGMCEGQQGESEGVYAPDLCVTELVMQECRAGRSVPEGHGQQGGPEYAVGCVWQGTQVFGDQ